MTSRRNFIRRSALTSAGVLSAGQFSFAIQHDLPDPDGDVIGHGEFRYRADRNWAQLSVQLNPLYDCHEMVQDRKGRLIMLGNHVNNNILIFDKSGKLLDFWGKAFPGGHGLSISREGEEDFLLITDCGYFQDRRGRSGKQSGQVVKMTLDGRLIFAIGHPRTIGIYKDDEPFMPTETAVAPNGDIYVADGYGSDYIIQYDSHGRYVRHFGGRNNANKDQNLINAHGVAIDLRNASNPTVICTSREENCFKVFTMDGKFIRRIDLPGMYVCRPVIDRNNIYAGVCWSKDAVGKRNPNSGFITILDENNKVLSSPGGTAPVYESGVLQPTFQAAVASFQHGHDVCVDDDLNLYVCQWRANYTAPVKLTRVA